MQQDFLRPAGTATAWLDELPDWAEVSSIGNALGYWMWRGQAPGTRPARIGAWGSRAGFGGRGEFGLLGGRFEPHEYPYLQVSVATASELGGHPDGPWHLSRVGLPVEYVGGVLAGALQEPERLGPGRLVIEFGAVHEVDSSWEVFRLVAIGLVRLLALPLDIAIPVDLLPRFGGEAPPGPGSDSAP